MKIITPLFFILLFGTPAAFSQTKEVINDIKKKYIIITELLEKNELTQSLLQSNCEGNSLNDTFLGFYYNNDALVYINYSYSQGHSNYNYHYYIWNNKVIFYFSNHASWMWDYECTPKDQGNTNEIWTHEEQRVYFMNSNAIKCLYKTYEEKSIDQLYDNEIELSDTVKNKEVNCDEDTIDGVIKKYRQLLSIQKNQGQNICDINID